MSERIPNRFHTKIVGVTFEGRQALLKEARDAGVRTLKLRMDPTNTYDAEAVAVDAELPGNRVVQVGFISNKDLECQDCFALVPAPLRGKSPVCPTCGAIGDEHFKRNGLASQLTRAMKSGVRYVCRVEQFTGGEFDGSRQDKTVGCNVYIEQLELEPIP